MNAITKTTCAALLSGLLLTTGAQAATITPSVTAVTLGQNETAFSVSLSLSENQPFAGAEFGLDLPEGVTLTKVDYLDDAVQSAAHTPQVQRDGRTYFGFYQGRNAFQGEYQVARLTFAYTGEEQVDIVLGSSSIVTLNEDGTTTGDADSAPFTIQVTRTGSSSGGSSSGGSSTHLPDEDIPLGSSPFTDISGHWAEDEILRAVELGLFKGTSETTFSPDLSLSRAMLVTVLHRQEGTPEMPSAGFGDVDQGSWYTKAVDWAAGHSIVNGVGGNRFAPDAPITREQAAVMLFRYASYLGLDTSAAGDLSAYADQDAVSSWAREAMGWAVQQGLIQGTGEWLLAPQGTATRAQTAVLLLRLLAL